MTSCDVPCGQFVSCKLRGVHEQVCSWLQLAVMYCRTSSTCALCLASCDVPCGRFVSCELRLGHKLVCSWVTLGAAGSVCTARWAVHAVCAR
jgi:hypothetical protein